MQCDYRSLELTASDEAVAHGLCIRHTPCAGPAHGVCGILLLGLFMMGLLSGCASYQIGNQTLYPVEVHTVYVPMFESASFRRNLGERLTEAVQKEVELKSPYKVVADPNADSILSGRIVEEGKQVLIGSRVGDPRELQVNIRVMVSWTDRQGRMLRESSAVPLPSELIDVEGSSEIAPQVGQSIATAQQEAIVRVAEQIVSLMEKPW
jgi:hypothetical protein